MKALLVIKSDKFDWMQGFFPDGSPLQATVCNKPLLEYLLDFAILCEVREVRLVSDMPLARLEAAFGDGGRWGVELTYATIRATDDLPAILLKNSRFGAGSRLLVMDGCFFLNYDKQKNYGAFMQTAFPGELLTCDTGRILIHDDTPSPPASGADVSPPPMALTPVRSIGDLYRLSLRVLEKDAHNYVLPGYSNEKDVYLGRNVMIAQSAQVVPPVMIGDHVRIHKNAVVGPNAVVCRNVIIDAHSQVQQSVILESTYVGEHLILDHKLVGGSHLADPDEETVVKLEDANLLSSMHSDGGRVTRFQRLGHGFLAALLWVVLVIPFGVVTPVLKLQGRWRRTEETYWLDRDGRTIRLARIAINRFGLWGRIGTGFSLDRFPLLGQVMRGNLVLIGSRLLPATDANRMILETDAGYRPGIFSYAEAEYWPVPESDQEIVNRFHLAHRSLLYDWVMMVKVLLNKLHEETAP